LYPTDPTAINTGFLFDVTTGQQILQLPGDGVTKGIEAYEALAISGGRAAIGLEGIGKALLVDTLIGDYNRDGKITAADYTTWRNSLGDTVEAYMGADGNGDTVIGIADYLLWKANYGVAAPMPISLGAGAATSQAIPEPTTWLNVLLAAVTAGTAMRWRSKLAGRPARR
jgi:hypothetical protein